jgi:hypothetical protein
MRITQTLKLLALSLSILVVAAACGDGVDSASDRISGTFAETSSERLSDRADDTRERLSGAASDLTVLSSETVTLSQLNAAGIPVGSNDIDCDDPLDVVMVEGMFDSDNLFSSGIAMAGGGFEAMAMDLVLEIYDPERDMPLGMIGGQNGGQLTGITQDQDGGIATGSIDGGMMLTSGTDSDDDAPSLIPESTCD